MLFHGEIVSMMILGPAKALSTSRCTRSGLRLVGTRVARRVLRSRAGGLQVTALHVGRSRGKRSQHPMSKITQCGQCGAVEPK